MIHNEDLLFKPRSLSVLSAVYVTKRERDRQTERERGDKKNENE